MTSVTFQIPDSIHDHAQLLAQRDGVSLDQLFASAVAEKIAALEAADYLATRAARGNRDDLGRILANVPARPPLPGDELPAGN